MFSFLHRQFDDLNNALDICDYIARPKANDLKIVFLEPCCAALIVTDLIWLEMLIAIDFNDKTDRQANEICKIWSE